MDTKNAVVVVQPKKVTTVSKVGLVAASVLLPALSYASEIDTIGANLSAEIDGSKAIVIALFGAGAVLLGLFAGYRYMKRGANSA